MNRKLWLVLAVVILAVGNILWRIYAGWGLITIHADKKPILEIIKSIERQGHVRIVSNVDGTTAVTIHIDKVPLGEALEVLSVNTDARWRLCYTITASGTDKEAALAAMTARPRPEGWRVIDFPMPMMDQETGSPDPRRDAWKPVTPGPLQQVLEGTAKEADVSFVIREPFNPDVRKLPGSGELRKVVPKIASLAGAKATEYIRLTTWRPGGNESAQNGGDENRGPGGPPGTQRSWGQDGQRGPQGGRPNPEEMAARIQQRISQLPPDQRAAAQAEFEKNRAFWQSLRDLPPDERRDKIQDFMSDPQNQSRMDQRMGSRDARMSPEQRADRYRGYVQRKAAQQQKTTN